MAKVLDSDIIVSKFELQFFYCIHFGANIPGKFMNFFILLQWIK